MPSDVAPSGWSGPNDSSWNIVRELSASLSHPAIIDRIRSMLADYLFASEVNADKTRAKLKTAPFVVAMSEVPMIAEHNLTGYITDETAMRLYCCDRFHFEKARELLALPDSKDGPKSTADLAADQACIAVIDRTIEAVKTATPLLFPQGIQSHKLAGLKPSGRVRPPKEATVPAPDSMSL